MSDRMPVGTRKGLFVIERGASGWDIAHAVLLGDPIIMFLVDGVGHMHAAAELGHFGVKLMRSSDCGHT